MGKRLKISAILISIVLIAVFATSIGLTLAIWTTVGAGSGDNTVAPATDSPEDWNVWAKYFDYVVVNEASHTCAITSFHSDVAGLNLETVIIPKEVEGEGGIFYTVVEVRSDIFSETTLKQLPVNVYISPTVQSISPMAFANLTCLEKLVFGKSTDPDDPGCTVADFAFMDCENLSTVIKNGRTIIESANAYLGCPDGRVVVA